MRRIDREPSFATLFSTLAIAFPGAAPTLAPGHRGVPQEAARRLRRGLETMQAWRERARGRRELLTLDGHMLRDIGITRLQAEAEAYKPFWRV
jgi:uncharacterized protein YjiS (DUF1127 family)